MNNDIKCRDLDYLLMNKKKFIGCFIVQFQCQEKFEKVYDIGQITDITGNDVMFWLKVDGNTWLMYSWDIILPEVQEDDSNITIHDKILDIRFVILKKDRPK